MTYYERLLDAYADAIAAASEFGAALMESLGGGFYGITVTTNAGEITVTDPTDDGLTIGVFDQRSNRGWYAVLRDTEGNAITGSETYDPSITSLMVVLGDVTRRSA